MFLRQKTAIVVVCWVAVFSCLIAFIILLGSGYLTKNYGPVNVWFRSWDGDVTIPNPEQPYELVLKPAQANPCVVAIRVSGNSSGKATLRSKSGDIEIILPEESGQLCVFDWYGGNLNLEYVPEHVSAGEEIRIQWKFGYE